MKVTQSCPTLCDPIDYTIHGILQARILEWVAVLFSRGPSQPGDQTQVSHIAGGFFTRWVTGEAQIEKTTADIWCIFFEIIPLLAVLTIVPWACRIRQAFLCQESSVECISLHCCSNKLSQTPWFRTTKCYPGLPLELCHFQFFGMYSNLPIFLAEFLKHLTVKLWNSLSKIFNFFFISYKYCKISIMSSLSHFLIYSVIYF